MFVCSDDLSKHHPILSEIIFKTKQQMELSTSNNNKNSIIQKETETEKYNNNNDSDDDDDYAVKQNEIEFQPATVDDYCEHNNDEEQVDENNLIIYIDIIDSGINKVQNTEEYEDEDMELLNSDNDIIYKCVTCNNLVTEDDEIGDYALATRQCSKIECGGLKSIEGDYYCRKCGIFIIYPDDDELDKEQIPKWLDLEQCFHCFSELDICSTSTVVDDDNDNHNNIKTKKQKV